MNKSWSELNRKMQIQLKKEATFSDGIETLFELRKELMQVADGFFRGNYKERTNSPIITTGNELVKQQIAEFSRQLNLGELQNYIHEVKAQTEKILCALSYSDLKKKVSAKRRKKLESLNVVSTDESAAWLVDYWCGKDFRGLVQMPFSRHWIMHIEAALRIVEKLRK